MAYRKRIKLLSPKAFICRISASSNSKCIWSTIIVLILSKGNGNTEKLCHIPQATQPIGSKQIQTQQFDSRACAFNQSQCHVQMSLSKFHGAHG